MQYVYVLRAGADHYKVGVAKDVSKRLSGLQTANPIPVEVVCTKLVDDAYALEGKIHTELLAMKVVGAGNEWFKLTPESLINLLVRLNKVKSPDLTQTAKLRDILAIQADNQKRIETSLRRVIAIADKQLADRKAKLEEPRKNLVPQHRELEFSAEYIFETTLNRAIEVIRQEGRASTSLLQRKLSIGYGRAAKVMDELEQREIITKADGTNKPRQLVQ